jgi:hypothetical protein
MKTITPVLVVMAAAAGAAWLPVSATQRNQAVKATDPFAYCAAVGTVDAPDARYGGPAVPPAVVAGLRKELQTPEEFPSEWLIAGTSWRCMNGTVWACFVGANLPCAGKADTNRAPGPALVQYCKANADAPAIPASVTGRTTVFRWRCSAGTPAIIDQVVQPDARGFISSIWHEIR